MLVLRCNPSSKTEVTRLLGTIRRHAAPALEAYVNACSWKDGQVSSQVRDTHLGWQALLERVQRLRLVMDQVSSEAAAALTLAQETADIYTVGRGQSRAWCRCVLKLRELNAYLRDDTKPLVTA